MNIFTDDRCTPKTLVREFVGVMDTFRRQASKIFENKSAVDRVERNQRDQPSLYPQGDESHDEAGDRDESSPDAVKSFADILLEATLYGPQGEPYW
jgi:hypothetical protein